MPLPAASLDEPVLKNLMFSITFDNERDVEILDLLSEVQNGQRSSLIKSILRCSLSRPCLYAQFKDYPAPFPVNRPESAVVEHITPTRNNATPITTQSAAIPSPSLAQASDDAPKEFNIFDFDDRIV